jgi:hypothetical protein
MKERLDPLLESRNCEMNPTTVEEAPALIPTGIPLSYLLPPNNIVNTEPRGCPTVLCGSMPASTVLHLAISHNVTSKDYARLASLRGSVMQQDTMPVGRSILSASQNRQSRSLIDAAASQTLPPKFNKDTHGS